MKFIFLLCVVLFSAAHAATEKTLLILGHRGACGYRPEHTLASYQLAIDMGADYIEPDLVSTKDGILIARHENEISETTDVAAKFPDRKTTKTIDSKSVTGWFAEDFTLKEIKTLRTKERLTFRDHSFDGQFEIPTFKEVIELAKSQSKKLKRTIGLYPETKHPTYFQSIKLSLEEPLARELKTAGLHKKSSAVFIQSFELGNLKKLKTLTKNKLIFLIDNPEVVPADFQASGDKRTYLQLMTPEGLKEIKKTADGIGPYKRYLLPTKTVTDKNGESSEEKLSPTPLVKLAHSIGLLVHPYTFRSEEKYLLKSYNKDPQAEYLEFFALGVDGVFTDFADQAVKARETYLQSLTKKETR